jgi:alcohol dehydrogenase, propanol-preferring
MSDVAVSLPGVDLPATMRAVRLRAWGTRPELVEVPVPVPTAGEVLLRVDAAGLCHSDLHVMDAAEGTHPYQLPFTLGHEIVGTVVSVGVPADEGMLGRQYAVHGIWSCGRCRMCRTGRDNYCVALTGPIGGGLGYDGGLSEYVLLPSSRHLVHADGVDPAALAPLTDAGLTAYHAVRDHLPDLAGAVVSVMGVGGLGHLAVQLLAQHGAAELVAVDPRAEARELALRLGASHAVANAAELAGVLPDGHADLIVDFVGAEATVATLACLAPGGDYVLVGSAGALLTVGKAIGLNRGWSVSAPFWGPYADLAEVVGLAAADTLRAEVEGFTLDEAVGAYERLRAGAVRGRAVVLPHG